MHLFARVVGFFRAERYPFPHTSTVAMVVIAVKIQQVKGDFVLKPGINFSTFGFAGDALVRVSGGV